MKTNKQYTIGESIEFYAQRVERDSATLAGLRQLVADGTDPNDYVTQDWRSSIRQQLELKKMRELIRAELRAEMALKKA